MYDPCKQCQNCPRQHICRNFCTTYKTAVREDTRKGLAEIGMATHDRLTRAQK